MMEKRYVSIWFPYLLIEWFTLQNPQYRNTPFVLCEISYGKMMIAEADKLAISRGIFRGMSLADAKAIFPGLLYADNIRGLATRLLTGIARWCIRFTPVAAVDLPNGILLDVSGCTHLWGGEKNYIADLKKRIEAKGYSVSFGLTDTIGASWALARFGQTEIAEPFKQIESLLPLPPECLRLDVQTTSRLEKLGLRRIQDFISFPESALARRFGPLIVKRLKQASGTEAEMINPVQQTALYQERIPCFEPIIRIEGIEIALKKLLEMLCARLVKEGKGLRCARLKYFRVDEKKLFIEIKTAQASANAVHLFNLFQLKLNLIEPEPGIEFFILEAIVVEDYTPAQESIWKNNIEFSETKITELIDRINTKTGNSAICRFLPQEHYWPERSFRKALSINEQPSTQWQSNLRPLQVLKAPERIEVTAPVPDYPPMLFRYNGKIHKIRKADGPERIEQEWWIQDGQHRDYYAVEDEEGCRYWLFRSGHYDAAKTYQWYIHGFFA